MAPIIYHGEIDASDFITALKAHFNRSNYLVTQMGSGDFTALQIASNPDLGSGGSTSLSVTFQKVPDGIAVDMGKQAIIGVAASFGLTALAALINPRNIFNRIDDLAQDITSIQLTDEVKNVLEQTARSLNSSFEFSDKLRRNVCEYCDTPNGINNSHCIACGAPMGGVLPKTCKYCGFILAANQTICPNCNRTIDEE